MVIAAASPQPQTFKLREVSVFKLEDRNFLRGQWGPTQDEPLAEVRAYPEFKSAKPIYGSVRFAQDRSDPKSGRLFCFAVDESSGTGRGYDRFYFDLNQDLDLRNDPVVKPHRDPPRAGLLRYSGVKEQVLFGFLNVDFDLGPDGTRSIQIMPRLIVSGADTSTYHRVSFVRTTFYEGAINIGDEKFTARLGNDYSISGRLDAPGAALVLSKQGGKAEQTFSWWGGDRLMAAHKIGDQYFTFSAHPLGRDLVVSPYLGEVGTFEIGAGGRKLDTVTIAGSLQSRDRAVAVGEMKAEGRPAPATRCQLPVGDYLPNYLTIQLGRLQIRISHNYHAEGKPRDRGERPLVYGMAIRKDEPFVLDFRNKPEVMFASPAKDQRIKVGDQLEVKAVLTDPQLDFMIRGLEDTTRKQTKSANGTPLSYERNLSLDPTVVISRANGKKVAEGVMPFG